jgi:hypothetical protein
MAAAAFLASSSGNGSLALSLTRATQRCRVSPGQAPSISQPTPCFDGRSMRMVTELILAKEIPAMPFEAL